MRIILSISIFFLLLWYVCCYHLLEVNESVVDRVVLAKHERVKYYAIPFMKREKYYFYSHPQNKIIEYIQALDMLNGRAFIDITAGGVGSSFVNFRLESERGSGLDYDIGIYVLPDSL